MATEGEAPAAPPPTRWTPRRRAAADGAADGAANGAADTAAIARPRRGRALAGLALSLLVGLITLALLGLAGTLWLLRSEAGTAWLLPRLPGIEASGVRGALWGEFSADRVVIDLPDQNRLVLAEAGWRDLRVERSAAPGAWLRLFIGELRAARGELQSPQREGRATAPAPTDLGMPLELEIGTLSVGELRLPGLGAEPLRGLTAHLHLGAEAGTLHRIDRLALTWDRLRASGTAQIATRAPLALTARIDLAQPAVADLPAWAAEARLAGPLAAPQLQATLRAQAQAARPAQSLDLSATLKPFAAWPLGDLQATARGLDLSALHSAAPATTLDLDASAATRGLDQPASVMLDGVNQLAGRWDQGRLPLRSLKLELSARPDDLATLEVRRFEGELGSAAAPAGRVTGSGRWSAPAWSLAATLDALQPARLDARAPAMSVSGPVQSSGGAGRPIQLEAGLAGTLAQPRSPARAVQLALDAAIDPLRIELRSAAARAGAARATLAGELTRGAVDAPWRAVGKASLVDIDPALWWPGSVTSPWRKGPHRLNASAGFDLLLPNLDRPAGAAQRLAALRGQADLRIAPSVLAGVAIGGEAALRSAGNGPLQATLALTAAGNRVNAEGRVDLAGSGAADAWSLKVDAPALAGLAPLLELAQPDAAAPPLAGALTAQGRLAGRWPLVASEGDFIATGLRIGSLAARRADGRWKLASSPDAPVEARVQLEQARLDGQPVDSALLELKGSARAHTLALRATAKGRPPAWVDGVQSASAAAPATTSPTPPATTSSVALLQAEGGLVDTAGAITGWRGRVRQLEVRPDDPAVPAWLRAGEVGIDLQWAGATPRLVLAPGRVELLGAALRWSRFAWQAGAAGAAPRIEGRAELEPLRIAPLLARWQPDFGWGGDLGVAGRIELRSADGFSADLVLERVQGDLSVTDESTTLALGLTELRLALAARDGVWTFTPRLAGSRIGVLSGSVVANAAPAAVWPGAEAPLRGTLEARLADLGTLGTWVPPGWRIGGELRASAAVGGRFGAPEYTGTVTGSRLEARNFLEGVNIADGELAIALQGTTARIERFVARAGNGTLRLEGSASLGETPKADLALIADRFQLLGRVDRRIVASGRGRLQLDRENLRLDGGFDIDEGLIDFTRSDAPSLSDDVVVVRRGRRVESAAATAATAAATAAAVPAAPPPTARPGARKVALDLRVGLGRLLHLRGRGIDTLLQGELRASAPGGRLALAGTVQTVGGSYAAYGQKLVIDRGRIVFNGPVENPRLDIEATRPNLDLRVGVAVGGTALNPRVRLFSEPEMAEVDKLSWLVLGRASDGLGRTETALLQRAALALLAGEGPGMTDQLTKAIGLDELAVRQTDGEVRETVVSLGKQLSQRWYVGYERSLSATTGTWQLIYRIAQRFTLRAQSGLDNSLDLIWTWRWQ